MKRKSAQFLFLPVLAVLFFAGCSASYNFSPTPIPDGATPSLASISLTTSTPLPRFGPPIHSIQGDAQVSPLNNQEVNNVHGVVTAVKADGFYMQDPSPDSDNGTSEGIFIFTAAPPSVKIGDEILVSGKVSEFYPGGIATGNLSVTEIKNPRIAKIKAGYPLPTPVVIGRGGRVPPPQVIKGGNEEYNPDTNDLDFYESMEVMLVQVNQAVVVGPTNDYKETAILADDGKDAGLRTLRGGILIRQEDFNPERIIIDDLLTKLPDFNVGDSFDQPITGILDYSFGNFKLELTKTPSFQPGQLTKEIAPDPKPDELSLASMNVQNLDPGDGKTRFDEYARLIVNNLRTPDIISLDEIQDNNGLTDDLVTDASQTYRMLIDAVKSAGGPTYDYRDIPPERNQDGGEPGGNIRVGFLFRTDRGIHFIDRGKGGAADTVGIKAGSNGPELTLNPGRIEPNNPAFSNSRKPLVGEFLIGDHKIFLIGVHLNSKGGNSPIFGRYQPPVLSSEKQRIKQAEVIRTFIDTILQLDEQANILVLGDFNDFQFSTTLKQLTQNGLENLVLTLPENQQYSYVYDGNSQVLDQLVASHSLAERLSFYNAIHVNAEFAFNNRLSDHDPILSRFKLKSR